MLERKKKGRFTSFESWDGGRGCPVGCRLGPCWPEKGVNWRLCLRLSEGSSYWKLAGSLGTTSERWKQRSEHLNRGMPLLFIMSEAARDCVLVFVRREISRNKKKFFFEISKTPNHFSSVSPSLSHTPSPSHKEDSDPKSDKTYTEPVCVVNLYLLLSRHPTSSPSFLPLSHTLLQTKLLPKK